MSQQPLAVELRGPLIDELTAFQSLAEDFKFALRAADELKARLPQHVNRVPLSEVDTIAYALWISLVATYGRCFNQGQRYAAARSLPRLPTLQLDQAHRDILELRDEHIAHFPRNSRAEQSLTRLIVEPFALPHPKLTVYTVGAKTTIPGSPDFLTAWIDLLRLRVDQAEERINAISEEVHSMVAPNSVEEMLALADKGRPLRLEQARPDTDSTEENGADQVGG
jgi:hypothetical protein